MPISRNRPKPKLSPREQLRRAFQSGRADRVSNRELRRRAKAAIVAGRQAYTTLLAVLAQSGGEVTITRGTLEQVNQNYSHLGFVVESRKDNTEFVVRLTEGREEEKTDEDGAGDASGDSGSDADGESGTDGARAGIDLPADLRDGDQG